MSKTFAPLLDIPGDLVSTNLHPLVTAILHIIIDISTPQFSRSLVDSLVSVLKEESTRKNSAMCVDGLKLLIKVVLGKSPDLWSYFVEKGNDGKIFFDEI